MAIWHAYAEKNGTRLAGSDLDAIEANTADNAARRATRFYWIERRQLFDLRDDDVREITVVVAEHILVVDANGDTTTPRTGKVSRWACRALVKSRRSDFDVDFDASDSDATEVTEITVKRVTTSSAPAANR